MRRNILYKKVMKTKGSCIIVLLVSVILVGIARCTDKNHVEGPTGEDPWMSVETPLWSPDGSQIIFNFGPLLKMDDTTYEVIKDSCGVWFIKPDGSDLSMFMHFFPNGPFLLDWHPNGHTVLACFARLVYIELLDTTIASIEYFDMGVGSAGYNSVGDKLSVVVMTPVDSNGIWIMDTNGANPYLAVEDVAWLHDWSPDDRRFAFQDSDGGLSIVDSNDTKRQQLVAGAGMYSSPSFSPDSERIVFDMRMNIYPTDYEIYVVNKDGTNLRKLTTGRYPVWSPDGSRIAYVKYSYKGEYDEGNGQLWIMDSNGTNKMQLTFVREEEQ